MIYMVKGKNGIYAKYVKRILDILICLLIIFLFWWVYFVIALLVRMNLGTPVLYHQDRPGQIDSRTGKEKIFRLVKFRSMTDVKDQDGNLLPDRERLTGFGKMLRASSLDELPELWNILKGDMSIIGPRPLAVRYLKYYTNEERHRHDVKPGLSGLAQIHGRNDTTWEQRFGYDLEYVENVSFLLDMKIIFKTMIAVMKHEGIGNGDLTNSLSRIRSKNPDYRE